MSHLRWMGRTARNAKRAALVVREAMTAYESGDHAALSAFVHPEARIEMLLMGGTVAEGPDGLRAALLEEEFHLHRPTLIDVEPIDDDGAMMIGRIQYESRSRGIADQRAVWLVALRDGLIWRVRPYRSRTAAREGYRVLRATRSST